jgi:hypothetical protein
MLILSINVVLACKYIGQSKKKCFEFSRAAPHRQDGSDTIPTRNKSYLTCYTLDIKFLTCGNVNLTYEQNCIIIKYVFHLIKCSKRFLII